jgi:hypothetical protein
VKGGSTRRNLGDNRSACLGLVGGGSGNELGYRSTGSAPDKSRCAAHRTAPSIRNGLDSHTVRRVAVSTMDAGVSQRFSASTRLLRAGSGKRRQESLAVGHTPSRAGVPPDARLVLTAEPAVGVIVTYRDVPKSVARTKG